jgi:uncharacterized membrane protein YdfJ with MMPL/SSD domain
LILGQDGPVRIVVRRPPVLLLAVVVIVLVALAGYLVTSRSAASGDDQCAKPMAERTGGWFCYSPGDGSPSPGTP